jgi:hypothetical protein
MLLADSCMVDFLHYHLPLQGDILAAEDGRAAT